MKFSRIIANSGEWLSGDGPNRQIVVSSRVRLARNLRDKPFPGWAKKSERLDVMNLVKQAVEHRDHHCQAGVLPLQRVGSRETDHRQGGVCDHGVPRDHQEV